MVTVFSSCAFEVLARCGWYLYVRQFHLGHFRLCLAKLKSAHLAGSSSQILASSGASSKGVDPTSGPSGSVVMASSLFLCVWAVEELAFAFCRFIPLHAWQPSRP